MKAYYFVRQNGRSPLEQYLQSINDLRQLAAIKAIIDRLIQSNGVLPEKLTKRVTGKIWELRTGYGNRVFYYIHGNSEIILLDGYTKKRNRIESRVLNRVRGLYELYMMSQNRIPYS